MSRVTAPRYVCSLSGLMSECVSAGLPRDAPARHTDHEGAKACCFTRRRGQGPESAGNSSRGRAARTDSPFLSIHDPKFLEGQGERSVWLGGSPRARAVVRVSARNSSVGAETTFAGARAQCSVWCPRGTSRARCTSHPEPTTFHGPIPVRVHVARARHPTPLRGERQSGVRVDSDPGLPQTGAKGWADSAKAFAPSVQHAPCERPPPPPAR